MINLKINPYYDEDIIDELDLMITLWYHSYNGSFSDFSDVMHVLNGHNYHLCLYDWGMNVRGLLFE